MTVWNPPSSDGSYDDLDLADLADFNVDIIEVRDEMAYPDPTVIVRGLYRRRPASTRNCSSPWPATSSTAT